MVDGEVMEAVLFLVKILLKLIEVVLMLLGGLLSLWSIMVIVNDVLCKLLMVLD